MTLNDLLTPLAITVIVDNKVRDPELAEFRKQAQGLIDLYEFPPMSGAEIQSWFIEHEPALAEGLESRKRNTIILRALTRFSDDSLRENIYDAMLAISICDQEYAEEESELIKSAASIWGFVRPPFETNREKA